MSAHNYNHQSGNVLNLHCTPKARRYNYNYTLHIQLKIDNTMII